MWAGTTECFVGRVFIRGVLDLVTFFLGLEPRREGSEFQAMDKSSGMRFEGESFRDFGMFRMAEAPVSWKV